jgi:hypothetical protein
LNTDWRKSETSNGQESKKVKSMGDMMLADVANTPVSDDAKPNCICNRTADEYDEDDLMIECDICKDWFHAQ